MTHEIEEIDGVAQMAYAGEAPWHGLGVAVSNDLSPFQIMEKAGLNWEVRKYNAFVDVKGKRVRTGRQGLVRMSDNKVLTTVGPGWNPVQNEDAFNFFHEFVLEGDMEMHTAGSLKDGQMIWALAKIKESFDIFNGDKIDSFLLFSNPHQYGKSIDIRFTPIRVVCNNTLTMSLSGKQSSYTQGHTSVFNTDLVKETLGIAREKFSKYREMAEFLGSKKVTIDKLLQYYDEVFPRTSSKNIKKDTPLTAANLSRNAKIAHEALTEQPGAEFAEGTWWSALNSVTYVTDHRQGRNADNRLYSNWFGGNQARKLAAAKRAVDYASAP